VEVGSGEDVLKGVRTVPNRQTPIENYRKNDMKLLRSLTFALSGLRYAITTQLNFRVHIFATLIVSILGFAFKIRNVDWIMLSFCIAMVLTAELINTAIEKLCDMITEEFHPSIKVVKDISASAVFILAATSVVIGIMIFYPFFIKLV
jgi:diacylglycerol kinase